MFQAKQSGKFESSPGVPGHRKFVMWLFKLHYKCKVEDYSLLEFKYLVRNGTAVTQVSGEIGRALSEISAT